MQNLSHSAYPYEVSTIIVTLKRRKLGQQGFKSHILKGKELELEPLFPYSRAQTIKDDVLCSFSLDYFSLYFSLYSRKKVVMTQANSQSAKINSFETWLDI